MEPSRIRVTFRHSGESVIATPSGTYEQIGEEIVVTHDDGTVVARLSREQVQVSAIRAEGESNRLVRISRQPDGSWTAHPQPPLPATTTFVTNGWAEIARLRNQLRAVEQFETGDNHAFVQEFGAPPTET